MFRLNFNQVNPSRNLVCTKIKNSFRHSVQQQQQRQRNGIKLNPFSILFGCKFWARVENMKTSTCQNSFFFATNDFLTVFRLPKQTFQSCRISCNIRVFFFFFLHFPFYKYRQHIVRASKKQPNAQTIEMRT